MRKPFVWLAPLLLLFGLAYAWLLEPDRIEISHHVISDGKRQDRQIRVVQLSDLHLRAFGRRERAVASEVVRLKPDLVVLSGDVIDQPESLGYLDSFLSLMGETPKVAVLGNWEYWSDVDFKELRSIYENKHGGRLLVNARADYQYGVRTLRVLGMDDFTAGSPDPDLLEQNHSGSMILVQHSPGWFAHPQVTGQKRQYSLCLSGHTHGGQVTLFGLVFWTPRGSGAFTSGLYDLSMCPLYVSRGIGTSILPIRFGSRPEIAVFDI